MDEAEIMKMIPHVFRSSQKKVWIDYDEGADVLYISFVYPPNSVEYLKFSEDKIADTVEVDEGVLIDYGDRGQMIGIEIINASSLMNTNPLHEKL